MDTTTKESFGDIIRGHTPVLVDFYAEWCAPCKLMKPILAELRQTLGDKMRILKIDIDKNTALSGSLNVSSVPTLMLFQKGKVIWRQSGVLPAKQILAIIQQKGAL